MLKNIIFDFDGVIHNTFELHLQTLQEHNPAYGMDAELYRDMHNGNFYEAHPTRPAFDFTGYDVRVREKQGSLKIAESVARALLRLSRTHQLFIVSSGSRTGIGDYLAQNGIAEYFTATFFKEDHLRKREKFKMLFATYGASVHDTVFITDTVGDVHEAKEISLKAIAVTFGFHDRARLVKAAPEALVDSWEELVALLVSSAKMNTLLSN